MALTVEDCVSLCGKVAELDATVILTAVLSKGKIVANRVKQDIFAIEGKEPERILVQPEILIGIPKTDESLYGKVGYVVVNHGSVDHILFPVRDSYTLVVSLTAPYRQELLQQVRQTIDKLAG